MSDKMYDGPSSHGSEPIVIVGMGCRWPGGVKKPSELWELLKAKQSGYADFPKDKINADGFYHANQHRPGSFYTKGGFFLNEDVRKFDHRLFNITPPEVMTMDPAQRKLLEVIYEAFESAGQPLDRVSGSRTGVYVGNFNYDHQIMQLRDADNPQPYATTGGGITILSNRVNHVFNLQGPSCTIDTACSSSLYALHMAVLAIRNNDCDAAIVGGSNLILSPEAQLWTTKLGAISPTSVCHTFDAAADGYARAEGIGALYIMRLSDALRGHHPIRAIVRGTAVNSNGRTPGISHPSSKGQEAVILQAYKNIIDANLSITGYFECHGTGTATGDPLEVAAVGSVFAESSTNAPLLIGSIKPNLGHSESASGIAGIMKSVLALEHGEIPPTIGVVNPNPKIDFEGSRVTIVTEMTKWPESKPFRRASVNSFGYGGANGHVILDHFHSVSIAYEKSMLLAQNLNGSPDARRLTNGQTNGQTNGHNGHHLFNGSSNKASSYPPFVLLPLSAKNDASLNAMIELLPASLSKFKLADIAYTLAERRTRYETKAFQLVQSGADSHELVTDSLALGKSISELHNLAFIFTGQGAQWIGMARNLFWYPVFQQTIDLEDKILQSLPDPPSWRIKELLTSSKYESMLNKAEITQCLCTAVQIGIVEILRSWKVIPKFVLGHSSGEIAAAFAAEKCSLAEAILAAYFRGQAVKKNQKTGAMLAVGVGSGYVQPYLVGYPDAVNIAAFNSRESVTLSGEVSAILAIQAQLQKDSIFCRVLKTDGNAYHSPHMLSIGTQYEKDMVDAFKDLYSSSEYTRPSALSKIVWISSVTGKEQHQVSPSYWRSNLEKPVLFIQALENMIHQAQSPIDALIEIGPHSALSGPIKQCQKFLREQGIQAPIYIPTLVRNHNDMVALLKSAGQLFLGGFPVDIVAVNGNFEEGSPDSDLVHGSVCCDLPGYAYQYGPILYHENRLNKEWVYRKHLHHDLLGARLPGTAKSNPTWRNMLRLKDVPWLEDHKVLTDVIFPAAGYLAMAIEAISQVYLDIPSIQPVSSYVIRNVNLTSTMVVPDDEYGTEVVTNLTPTDFASNEVNFQHWHEFRISSVQLDTNKWTEHCSGFIGIDLSRTLEGRINDTQNPGTEEDEVAREWYAAFTDSGLRYGTTFQNILSAEYDPKSDKSIANIRMKPRKSDLPGGASKYPVHPGSLDTCLQVGLLSAYHCRSADFRQAFVPIAIDELVIRSYSDEQDFGTCVASAKLKGLRAMHGSLQLYNQSRKEILRITGMRCVTYVNSQHHASQDDLYGKRRPYMKPSWEIDLSTLSQAVASRVFPPITKLEEVKPIFDALDQLTAYIVVEKHQQWGNQPPNPKSVTLVHFLNWFKNCLELAQQGTLKFGQEALSRSSAERCKFIETTFTELATVPEVKLIHQVYSSLDDILLETCSPLEVVLANNALKELYVNGIGTSHAYPQLQRVLKLFCHENPGASILEIGAGTGGATREIMKILGGADGSSRQFKSYCFTDVSSTFLTEASLEFESLGGMEFKTLNIEQDPTEQGYEATFDLIVASQVIHATKSLKSSLSNTRKLLRPGGKLILIELTQSHVATGLVLGTLPDFWNGLDDNRRDGPLATKAQWSTLLEGNGFSGIDLILDDHPQQYATASVIVATASDQAPLAPSVHSHVNTPLVFHTREIASALLSSIKEGLGGENNIESYLFPNVQTPSIAGRDLVFLADSTTAKEIFELEEVFISFQSLLSKAATFFWVSDYSPMIPENSRDPMITGLFSCISNENVNLRLGQLGLGAGSDKIPDLKGLVARAYESFRKSKHHEMLYALRDGCLYTRRIVSDDAVNRQYETATSIEPSYQETKLKDLGPIKASFEHIGTLNSLYFEPDPKFDEVLPDDWVELKTAAIGLNVKDLAVSRGQFDKNNLSGECSGIITNVGKSVTDFNVGDRVYGLVPGNFGNYMRCSSFSIRKMRSSDNFITMASTPIAFCSAAYALIHLAQLRKEDTILIQSAAGGLGTAALHIATHIGATVYATVSSKDKITWLQSEFGIPTERIFQSRDFAEYKNMLQRTNGKGFDVILCSSAGEHLHESWRCIAPLGRFIDVGRTEVLGSKKMNMDVFKRNATFFSFDLSLVYDQRPDIIKKLMQEVDTMFNNGALKPMDQIQTYDVSQLVQAMGTFSRATHIGKIVVTYQNDDSRLKTLYQLPRVQLNPDANYIIAGGLGGLGQQFATWMIERGARHVTILSRTPKDYPWMSELRNQNVQLHVIKCDIAEEEQVKTAISDASRIAPIHGILHAAMVLEDITFNNMNFEQLQKVTRPKVQGSINLHEATLKMKLDHFIMISSIVTVVGTATQSSYSAANTFQDSFARYRQSLGLAGQSIALGLITDVGTASSRPEIQQSLNRNGVYGSTSSEILQLLDMAYSSSNPHVMLGLEPGRIHALATELDMEFPWVHNKLMSHIAQELDVLSSQKAMSAQNKDGESESLLSRLASGEDVQTLVRKGVTKKMAKLLFIDEETIQEKTPLSTYGLDSMTSAEMKMWLAKNLESDMSVVDLLDPAATIHSVSQRVAEVLERNKST